MKSSHKAAIAVGLALLPPTAIASQRELKKLLKRRRQQKQRARLRSTLRLGRLRR